MQILGSPQYPGRWAAIDAKLTGYSWILVVFMAGWLASTGYYGVTRLWDKAHTLDKVETVVVPKLQKENRTLKYDIHTDGPSTPLKGKDCPQ